MERTTVALQPLLASGYDCSSCDAIVFMSASTCSGATPDLARPIAPNHCTLRTICPCAVSIRLVVAIGPEKAIGSHPSTLVTRVNPLGPSMPGYGNTKSAGITPITWKVEPLSVSIVPTTFGSAPKRRRQ
jgi:hypothetical protein